VTVVHSDLIKSLLPEVFQLIRTSAVANTLWLSAQLATLTRAFERQTNFVQRDSYSDPQTSEMIWKSSAKMLLFTVVSTLLVTFSPVSSSSLCNDCLQTSWTFDHLSSNLTDDQMVVALTKFCMNDPEGASKQIVSTCQCNQPTIHTKNCN
jgi:hypothetical protein